jgi:hypothetical protein
MAMVQQRLILDPLPCRHCGRSLDECLDLTNHGIEFVPNPCCRGCFHEGARRLVKSPRPRR